MILLTPKQIKAIRKKLGLTQRSLAELIDVKPNTVACWECGAAKCMGPAAVLLRRLGDEAKSRRKEPVA